MCGEGEGWEPALCGGGDGDEIQAPLEFLTKPVGHLCGGLGVGAGDRIAARAVSALLYLSCNFLKASSSDFLYAAIFFCWSWICSWSWGIWLDCTMYRAVMALLVFVRVSFDFFSPVTSRCACSSSVFCDWASFSSALSFFDISWLAWLRMGNSVDMVLTLPTSLSSLSESAANSFCS